ncbi:MFS transporter [Candidatus Paraluminiphilus aquimaris]|uniref:MFS transporter n=1 Tax=Candidatus Paraluminiphilus aquimaris TaxID=2518994 RepID=A0ABY6Q5M5_9GAMM|nr:MFS transporter [Candidatus Paraluminiphilus aquimaris]UZP73835.1 MFS transporter [Candidatus Paraluminiphilus aquimaris]
MARQLNKRVLASYSMVALPIGAMAMPIAIYLPPFYSGSLGLSLATVGLIFTVARVWDLVTDPIMGVVIDRYGSRWGQYKHWVALAIPLLMLAVYKLFLPNPSDVSALYLGGWLLVLYVGYTMLSISHNSWGSVLAGDYDERSKIFGWREIFIILGMALVLAIPAALDLSRETPISEKLAAMGMFCLVLFPLTVLPTVLGVPDKPSVSTETLGLQDALELVRSNPTLWRLLFADFTTAFAMSATAALYIFFATYAFELKDHASLALLLYFLAGFLAMPAWLKLAYRMGKVGAIRVAIGYTMLLQAGLFFVTDPGNVPLFWGYTFLAGLAFGAGPTLLHSMMADLTDIDESKTGQKRAGMYFALLATVNKLGGASAVGLTLTLADRLFGFTPGLKNSPEAIQGLLVIFCFAPAAALAITYLPLHRYPLSKEKQAEIKQDLSEKA